MESNIVIKAFAALAQETRLKVFRMLIEAGPSGLLPKEMSRLLEIPNNTLSFHLAHLTQAQLAISHKEGRNIIYSANFDFIRELLRFMVKDCCHLDFVSCSLADDLSINRVQQSEKED